MIYCLYNMMKTRLRALYDEIGYKQVKPLMLSSKEGRKSGKEIKNDRTNK